MTESLENTAIDAFVGSIPWPLCEKLAGKARDVMMEDVRKNEIPEWWEYVEARLERAFYDNYAPGACSSSLDPPIPDSLPDKRDFAKRLTLLSDKLFGIVEGYGMYTNDYNKKSARRRKTYSYDSGSTASSGSGYSDGDESDATSGVY